MSTLHPRIRILLVLAMLAAIATWVARPAPAPLQLPLEEGALYQTREGKHVHVLIDRGPQESWRFVVSGPDMVRADGTAHLTRNDLVRRVSR